MIMMLLLLPKQTMQQSIGEHRSFLFCFFLNWQYFPLLPLFNRHHRGGDLLLDKRQSGWWVFKYTLSVSLSLSLSLVDWKCEVNVSARLIVLSLATNKLTDWLTNWLPCLRRRGHCASSWPLAFVAVVVVADANADANAVVVVHCTTHCNDLCASFFLFLSVYLCCCACSVVLVLTLFSIMQKSSPKLNLFLSPSLFLFLPLTLFSGHTLLVSHSVVPFVFTTTTTTTTTTTATISIFIFIFICIFLSPSPAPSSASASAWLGCCCCCRCYFGADCSELIAVLSSWRSESGGLGAVMMSVKHTHTLNHSLYLSLFYI